MRQIKNTIQNVANKLGYQIVRKSRGPHWSERLQAEYSKRLENLKIDKAHYGCGPILFGDGWVNIDYMHAPKDSTKLYLMANLASKHPFPTNFFNYSFAEDFIEPLDQAESIIFLYEAYRTLRPNGVLRMSVPGLRGALARHYKSRDYEGVSEAQEEAYKSHGHKHFFCEESLSIVGQHIGFSNILFVEYGKSNHKELCNLEYREDQKDCNFYVELTK